MTRHLHLLLLPPDAFQVQYRNTFTTHCHRCTAKSIAYYRSFIKKNLFWKPYKRYFLFIAGLFLLAYQIPVLEKLIGKIKQKDKKGRVEKVEKKINEKEQKLNEKIVAPDEAHQNSEKTIRD